MHRLKMNSKVYFIQNPNKLKRPYKVQIKDLRTELMEFLQEDGLDSKKDSRQEDCSNVQDFCYVLNVNDVRFKTNVDIVSIK